MARPLRIERAGAWYHVTGRGLERRSIFGDAKDCRHWLEQVKGQIVLGSQQLWQKVQKRMRCNRREQPQARRFVDRPGLREVTDVVEELKGQEGWTMRL